MAPPQGIYHTGSKDYLGDKATMLSSRWTQKQQNSYFKFFLAKDLILIL